MRVIAAYSVLISLLTSCSTDDQKRIPTPTNDSTKMDVLFADNNDSLINIIINRPPVKYCNVDHHHFVDIVAKTKIDSLKNIGIKDILFYRDWIGTNGLNGYGKLIWTQNGKCYQYQFNFENYDGRYGISSIDKSEQENCDVLNFYQEKRIDTVITSPKEPDFWRSHDADHFVYTYLKGKENCFNVWGLNLIEDSTHLKSQIINKLKISDTDYFDMLEARKKKEKL